MAAGIYDDQNKLVAGLSISAPSGRLEDGWLPKLRETANQISAALGHKSGPGV
jgi:DNA-binding IclR family transcriptional regulator